MLISHSHFKEELKNLTNKIMKILEIKNINKSYSFIEKNIKPIILEYYEDIFENENKSDYFYQKIKEDYASFVNKTFLNQELKESKTKIKSIMKSEKTDELNELIRSNYIKDFLKTIKKIFLFVEFHEPQLSLKIESFDKRKPQVRELKQNDCILADGYIKDIKNCLILLDPPLLKNGYPYSGLKPIALISPEDFKNEEANNNYNDNDNQEKIIDTDHLLVTSSKPSSIEIKANTKNEILENLSSYKILNENNTENDFSIPFKKEEKSVNRSKLSEIEKKEKIIQMILDNDNDKDEINNNADNTSIGFINFDKNSKDLIKKDELDLSSNKIHKNFDFAFSKNPNTSSSREFSKNDSKLNVQFINDTEKAITNENITLKEINCKVINNNLINDFSKDSSKGISSQIDERKK